MYVLRRGFNLSKTDVTCLDTCNLLNKAKLTTSLTLTRNARSYFTNACGLTHSCDDVGCAK